MIINIASGTGPMGKVHSPVFEAAGHRVIISGRKTSPSLEEATQQADLTIFSTPLRYMEPMIKRLAPFCRGKAMMDFGGVKVYPVKWMLDYGENCEVAGLHPEYGLVESIKGRPIPYCPTIRTGQRCGEIIKTLETAGAIVKEITPEEHDLCAARSQLVRTNLFKTLGIFLEDSGEDLNKIYNLSPPPTRRILELLARQVIDPTRDDMYEDMENFNPYWEKEKQRLKVSFLKALHDKTASETIRNYFGSELDNLAQRAKRLI